MDEVEKEIRFHLEKISGPMVKGDKYRAVIDTDKDESVDAIEEICKVGKFTSAELQDVVGKKVTVRFRPWSRDFEHTLKLKDADRMGSATKVIVLAP